MEEVMQKPEYPSFHKKNILKRSESEEEAEEVLPEIQNVTVERFDYPRFSLSVRYDDERYNELYSALEFYNNGKYDKALEQFEKRPPDPARLMKNFVCTFYGPIGWLLMYNTKAKKDKYVNFCIACCKYRMGNYADALERIKYDSKTNVVYFKAWCYYKLNQHDEAKKTFKEAFNVCPDYMFKYKFPYSEKDVL
jgi:tetratricopeptide (TPR) repeat protein